jgi:hypothetical protein
VFCRTQDGSVLSRCIPSHQDSFFVESLRLALSMTEKTISPNLQQHQHITVRSFAIYEFGFVKTFSVQSKWNRGSSLAPPWQFPFCLDGIVPVQNTQPWPVDAFTLTSVFLR